MEGKYDYIKVKPAENGWVLCYDEYMKNPMEADSDYGYSHNMMEKKMVFESDGSDNGMEKALDECLAKQKEMLLENRDMMMEHGKMMKNNPGPHKY